VHVLLFDELEVAVSVKARAFFVTPGVF
jgi:hypothetical protein